MVVEQGSKEAAITEAEQDFLFAATGEQEKEKTEAAASPSSLPEGEARAGAG
jgi:Tfp pilus assembly protein PilN